MHSKEQLCTLGASRSAQLEFGSAIISISVDVHSPYAVFKKRRVLRASLPLMPIIFPTEHDSREFMNLSDLHMRFTVISGHPSICILGKIDRYGRELLSQSSIFLVVNLMIGCFANKA